MPRKRLTGLYDRYRPWETIDDGHEHAERKVPRPPPVTHVPVERGYGRLGNEETDIFKQARKRVRQGERGLIEEQQTVQVTNVVTIWPRSTGTDDVYSTSATPDPTEDMDSTACERGFHGTYCDRTCMHRYYDE
jgi:hypothetical protein